MNAPDKLTRLKAAAAAALAFCTALWGRQGWAVLLWLLCLALDYVSGTAAARRRGEWSSEAARDGLWHKLGEIFAVTVAALCDAGLGVVMELSPLPLPFEHSSLVTPLVLLWYTITELGSILENAGKLGAKYPEWLRRSLRQYRASLDATRGGADGERSEDASRSENGKDSENASRRENGKDSDNGEDK